MKHIKIKPSETTVDHAYQRELDTRRVEAMAKNFDPRMMGVPVISRRPDGSMVRIDGQHRCAAAIAAGMGDTPFLVEVYDGLTPREEAELFLRLNGGRSAVGAIDKYKARIQAHEPTALEIKQILGRHGLRIAKAPARGVIMAVQAVESAYHHGTLDKVMRVLLAWLEGESEAFEGDIIRGVSAFFVAFPDADPMHLASRLDKYGAPKLLSRLRREAQQTSRADAARFVFSDIYNTRTHRTKRVVMQNVAAVGQA